MLDILLYPIRLLLGPAEAKAREASEQAFEDSNAGNMISRLWERLIDWFMSFQHPNWYEAKYAVRNNATADQLASQLNSGFANSLGAELDELDLNEVSEDLGLSLSTIAKRGQFDPKDIRKAGTEAHKFAKEAIIKELRTLEYAVDSDGKLTDHAMQLAQSYAASIEDGFTDYLKDVSRLINDESLSSEQVKQRVDELEMTFETTPAMRRALDGLQADRSGNIEDRKQARQAGVLLTADIKEEFDIDSLSSDQKQVINNLVAHGNIDSQEAGQLASAVDKELWKDIFANAADATDLLLQDAGDERIIVAEAADGQKTFIGLVPTQTPNTEAQQQRQEKKPARG